MGVTRGGMAAGAVRDWDSRVEEGTHEAARDEGRAWERPWMRAGVVRDS